MNWKNLLALPLLATVAAFGPAHSANSFNNNGTLLVTLTTGDSFVGVTTELGACADGSDRTRVDSFQSTGTSSEAFCGVVNMRVAGLSGTNALAIGGLPGLGFSIAGTLDIRGGSNNDTVIFGNDVSVGKLLITLRGGNNKIRGAAKDLSITVPIIGRLIEITTNSITVNTTLDIDTNNGNDSANFRALTVGGTADINLGGGNDKSNIYGGGGPNSFNKLFMRLGSGDNTGSIRNTTCHLCQVFTGNGMDDILLKNVSAGIDVDVIVAGGDDTVELKNVTSGTDVNANGGSGTDCLTDDGSATTDSNFEPCSS